QQRHGPPLPGQQTTIRTAVEKAPDELKAACAGLHSGYSIFGGRGQSAQRPPGIAPVTLSAPTTVSTQKWEDKRRSAMSCALASLEDLMTPPREICVNDGSDSEYLNEETGMHVRGKKVAPGPRDPFCLAACASRMASIQQDLAASEPALFAA